MSVMLDLTLLKGMFLFIEVDTLSGKKQIPVNLMAIKIGPIDAGKPGGTRNCNPTAATHAGTINHYWV
tara:strand:- start:94 stop:297 length:204 start_codon:yes stop_codon:yes gene_type:complete